VAVQRKNGIASSNRLKPSQVIDKIAPIAELFFNDEEVFGDGIYTAGEVYHKHLSILGMKSHFDSEIADNRIRKFAEMQMSDELYKKCGLLIDFLSDRGSSVTLNPEWSSLLRLPAISVNGQRVVLPPSECRPESFKPLVQSGLGIVSIDVKKSLHGDLGWNQILQPEVLGQRIDIIATSPSVQNTLAPIFEYIKSKAAELGDQLGEYIGKVKSQISVQKYLPGSIEGLWSCDDVFFGKAREFEPYLTILPRSYVSDFGDILKLFGVAESPSLQCLLNTLSKLPTDEILEANQLDLAINILSRLISFDNFDSNELRVPSIEGRLHRVNEFISSDNMFAHPRVPEAFAFKYQIPRVHSDAAFLHHLNEPDVFEDYYQEEQMTTRIANTLKEYSLSTSFNEFIANAEDCGSATRVSWYLDAEDTRFPSDNLFSSELSLWQTPGLYVYNDGVFSEDDFKAFINTGAGSKADDSSKIGKYGAGSLTMYHFTDIPSMISGNYFVMFDPSRRYLPLHQGRRRAGMRIPLEIMKMRHKDHLVPFTGIGGYSTGTLSFILSDFRYDKI
jgi:sacsin